MPTPTPTPLPNHDIGAACQSAAAAFSALSHLPPESRAAILDAIAAALDAQRDLILKTAADETALTIDELTPEFARTTGTLRMFAALIREGSWVRASIDTPYHGHPARVPLPPSSSRSSPDTTGGTPVLQPQAIGPNHALRKLLIPLGPVAVFGSSNFPLAYGVCGGDTASALAAGCPVIIKEHPAHPKTGRLLASIAQAAIMEAGFTEQLLGYLYNEDPSNYQIAQALVENPFITAVGFTGSTRGGISILNLATGRKCKRNGYPRPIPVFAEMGSCNVLIVLGHAFDQRRDQIADEIAGSLLARVGQQCTAPGILLVAGYERADWIFAALKERISKAPIRRMLSADVANNYYRRLDEVIASGIIEQQTPLPTAAQRAASLGVPVLLGTQAVKMEDTPTIWDEIFGPALVVAGCGYLAHGYFFASGCLAVSIYAEPEDDIEDMNTLIDESFLGPTSEIASYLKGQAGRLTFNSPPTGVRVATSMVHGGPFPAANRPDTTAVGPLAIERWCRPICYQNCPDNLLPPELQNANPRHLWRTLNGELTRSPIP